LYLYGYVNSIWGQNCWMIINLESDVTPPIPVLYSIFARYLRKKLKYSGTTWTVNGIRLRRQMLHRMNHFLLDQGALVNFLSNLVQVIITVNLCLAWFTDCLPSWHATYNMTSWASARCCLVKEEMVHPVHVVYTWSGKANQQLTCKLFVCVHACPCAAQHLINSCPKSMRDLKDLGQVLAAVYMWSGAQMTHGHCEIILLYTVKSA